jgi:hypothetical protein
MRIVVLPHESTPPLQLDATNQLPPAQLVQVDWAEAFSASAKEVTRRNRCMWVVKFADFKAYGFAASMR